MSTPIPGKNITLSSSRGSLDTITTTNGTTNASGQATFTLKSSKTGMPVLTASDTSDGITINQTFKLQMLASGSTPQTDYRSELANLGYLPGNNSLPVTSFQNVESSSNNGTLYNFGYTTFSGWSGDGSLLTSGALGPNRLVFDSVASFVNFGSGMNSSADQTFEIWMRPSSISSAGRVIISNGDLSGHGLTMRQSWDGLGRIQLTLGLDSYAGGVMALAPLGYWRLGETSGSVARDMSGNGYSGAYTGSVAQGLPGALPSDPDTSLFLSGAGYVSNIAMPNPVSSDWTEVAWIKSSTYGAGVVLSNRGSSNSGNDVTLALSVGYTNTGATSNNAYFFRDGPGSLNGAQGTTNVSDGNWHQIVGVKQTISGTAYFSIYVDGNPTPEGTNNFIAGGNYFSDPVNSTSPWMIGYAPVWGNYFSGNIDEVATFNYAMSPSQISALYSARMSTSCTSLSLLNSSGWTHLASIFNSSTLKLSLFFNGNEECTMTAQSGASYTASTVPLSAGAALNSGGGVQTSSLWSGLLAMIKTYSTPLSPSLVQQNYAATAAQFDIQQLGAPTPIMWLRADSIQGLSDGASVSTWPDSSANGNNATQVTSANQPIWKRSILNGYPVVRFDGANSYMNGPDVFPTNSDYTIFVTAVPGSSVSGIFLGDTGATHQFGMFGGPLAVFEGPNYYPSGNYIAGNSYIFAVTYTDINVTATLYANGTSLGNGSLGQSNTNSTVQIGARAQGFFFGGDISEIILYGASLSTNDRSLVESYLNSKYSIF